MATEEAGMDNCSKCGLELPLQAPPRDPCPKCGATTRIVNLGSVTLSGEASLQVKPEAQTIELESIPSEESVGPVSVTVTPLDVEYGSELFLFQIEQLTRASFVGICESDSHGPFVIGGASREEVVSGLTEHLRSAH